MNRPNILLYKWLVANSFATLLVYIAWLQDWITLVVVSDVSYLSIVIAAVFLVFWVISSFHMVSLNREVGWFVEQAPVGVAAEYFDRLRRKAAKLNSDHPLDQGMLAAALRARIMLPIQVLSYVANMLILLGLKATML